MILLPYPLRLTNAQMELDTACFYWQTIEAEVPQLIAGTYQRLFNELREGVDAEYEESLAVYLRDLAEEGTRRSSRAAALLQAWVVFEDALCWSVDELRRRGRAIPKRRGNESILAWAKDEVNLCAGYQHRNQLFERLDMLRRVRNIIAHDNGHLERMKEPDRTQVVAWAAEGNGVIVEDGRMHLSATFIAGAFDDIGAAISGLSDLCRNF